VTYTIIARDHESGQIGIAVTTHAYGVGLVAAFTRAGVGAVATQSFVDPSYGPLGLDLMEDGVPVEQAIARLRSADADSAIRQVALMDLEGNVAHFTGSRCVPACGAVVGDGRIAIGNMLASDTVLDATHAAYEHDGAPFAERLIVALEAGQAEGGDARGKMSAALQIVEPGRAEQPWLGQVKNLRIDVDPEPLAALRRSLAMSCAYEIFFGAVFAPGLVTGSEPVTGEALTQALASLDDAQETLGADREPTVWQGVLLLRAGFADEGSEKIASALTVRPQFSVFVDGLQSAGVITLGSAEILAAAGR
jgi:uncharacterized Ntn-hydrolase superfamily protein